MIKFLTGLFKKPDKPIIYHAICDIRDVAKKCQHVAYRHIPRTVNKVADDMARRALEAQCDLKYEEGVIPTDAPDN